MAFHDYYTLLGVGRQATAEDIKRAYRRLATRWHPDRNPGSKLAEERFKLISEAYAVLGSPAKRRQYDLLGPAEFKNEYSHEEIFQGFEPGDFFKLFGQDDPHEALARVFDPARETYVPGGMGEGARARMAEFFAGFGQKGDGRQGRSPDIIVPLMVSLREAALGAEKLAAYNTPQGAVKAKVAVPPGAREGQRLVLKGQGPARPGLAPGDLIVALTITPDPRFTARGHDLCTRVELTARELNEGCRPQVTTLAGLPLRLIIPPATIAGSTFKVAGHGLPKPGGGQGDLLVKVALKK